MNHNELTSGRYALIFELQADDADVQEVCHYLGASSLFSGIKVLATWGNPISIVVF
jgi:hypothetical protein